MYANDLLVICRANEQKASMVKNCLEKYIAWFGQEANAKKSSILFTKNTRKMDKIKGQRHFWSQVNAKKLDIPC